ncbi:MAG: hypothetical protein IJN96_07770 [Clostridia bacterium]|nr:hypothetical protein [Clostridia bacterium]
MKESNKNDSRRVFLYGVIMLLCVVLIVLIGFLTGSGIGEDNIESQNLIDEKQNNIRLLEEKVSALESEVESLTVEKNKYIAQVNSLTEQLQSKPLNTDESDAATYAQAFSDLKNIYETFKAGKVDEAKAAFVKIEPMGYDDATLAYYEILKDLLGKN